MRPAPVAAGGARRDRAAFARRRRRDPLHGMAWGLAALAAAFVALLLALLVVQSLPLWRERGLELLASGRWFYRGGEFGALAMLYGTTVVSLVALALALPVALGAAIFTAEVLPARWRPAVKVPIELLAAVPSVVYGLLGLLYLRQWIYRLLEPAGALSGDTLLTGGALLAVMILPTVATLADDALRGVPAAQRRAARGLGLTRAETVFRIALPQAAPGLVAAALLGLGRALGETIAVFLVVGRQDNRLPETLWSPRAWLEAGQTVTSKLGSSETFIAEADPLHWGAILGLALLLLAIVAGITLAGLELGGERRARWRAGSEPGA